MLEQVVKVAVTSILVVVISEVAKRNTLAGAVLASLPLTSLLAMIWLYADTRDVEQVASLASGIFWLVLPSLVLFIALPVLLRHGVPFVPSLILSSALTVLGYFAQIKILERLGITF